MELWNKEKISNWNKCKPLNWIDTESEEAPENTQLLDHAEITLDEQP